MAQSDARFGYKANLNRQDFDLSQRLGFTSACGMLLPIWCDIATPGDSYYMQHDLPLLRSTVLAQPAMVDVKVHYETFFVPAQMVYQPFENTLFSLKPIQSSNFVMGNLQNNQFPLFDYSTFVSTTLANETTSDYRADAFRLADLFGLNAYNFADANQGGSGAAVKPYKYVPSFFPWQLLTYHAIYEYFFRLDDKSAFQNDFANWDKHYGSTTPVTKVRDFMMIHQRPWEFDYFTSLYRSPIVSNDNMQNMNGSPFDDLFNNPNFYTKRVDSTGAQAGSNEDTISFSRTLPTTFSQQSIQAELSTSMIRQMFANEKLAMITGRTKKNYDSQVLAHYGVSVPHDVKHDITLIHHDEYDLNVQEVTSLSASSSDPLGELAGKSYAAGDGKKFKFTAPCHGFIMTIFSIEPKKRYTPAFDRINAIVDAFDLPTPEFDRLGNQPMFRYECGWLSETTPVKAGSDIIGWKERYYWNKRKFDKTTYAFFTPLAGSGGVLNNYAPYMLSFRPFGLNTGLTSGEQRPDLEGRYYIERNAVDSLCLIPFAYGWKNTSGGENWSETPWLAYARDPFIVNSFIKCTKVSWMSKDGEPIYNY